MYLNHRELRAILAIARSGSINAAAETVGMTQPALSRSLKRLEEALQARLFTRHPQGMALTQFGKALLRHAELVEFETARLTEEIRMLNGAEAGFVRIGLVPSAISNLLLRTLQDVIRAAPGVQVRIIEGAGNQMLEAVANGSVDFAILGSVQSDRAEDVVIETLGSEEVCVAASPSHPVFAAAHCDVAALARHAWVLPDKGNAIWVGFNGFFRSAGLEPPTPAVVTNSVHTIKTLVAEAGYLTMMTRVIFSLEEQNRLILPIPMPAAHWQREILLARRAHATLLPTARLFYRAFKREARLMAENT
jgi:DNA-binding transcriptional LysR family regulator